MLNEVSVPWRPTAALDKLKQRARILNNIRHFFAQRGITEVETPLLSQATVTDPTLHSLRTQYHSPGASKGDTFYLQTSPEFAMKRLLAAGSGPIFQICKAFRNNESGRYHNPEFSMLEWYRPHFDHHDMMDELEALLAVFFGTRPAERLSYQNAFLRYCEVDPFTANLIELQQAVRHHEIDTSEGFDRNDKDVYLQLLLTHVVEPNLGANQPTFIYDFPKSQAALARTRQGEHEVAERFEAYVQGIELANGYHELNDEEEQQRRFDVDLKQRRAMGLPSVPTDSNLLAALQHGMPNCAGVAVGIDRLVMLISHAESIADVIAFPMDRA